MSCKLCNDMEQDMHTYYLHDGTTVEIGNNCAKYLDGYYSGESHIERTREIALLKDLIELKKAIESKNLSKVTNILFHDQFNNQSPKELRLEL